MRNISQLAVCVIVVLVLGAILGCGKSSPKDKEGSKSDKSSKTIEISKSVYRDYPAVWFSPSTGEITPTVAGSEEPPEKKYVMWVEPRDPEFGMLSGTQGGEYGIQVIGTDAELFKSTKTRPKGTFSGGIGERALENKSVCYIKTPDGDCLIHILEWKKENDGYLKFKWRKL